MRKIIQVTIVFFFHVALTWVSLTKQAVIDQSTISPLWEFIAKLVKFPLMNLELSEKIYDHLGPLVIVNSLIVSAGLVSAISVIFQYFERGEETKPG